MITKLMVVGVACVGLLGLVTPACGSSSGGSGGDAGTVDTSTGTEAASKDGPAPTDTGGACTGLDAAAMMISYSAACGSCVEKNCCSQAQKCADDQACITIVKCQLDCIDEAGGTMQTTCATTCIDASDSSTGAVDATNFDECLIHSCMSECTG
jgi:hypothetical protein